MDMCRTCLKYPAKKDTSQLEKGIKEDGKNYIDIMLFCLDIKVTQDSKITTKLCNCCYRKIISFYKFKAQSLKNDAYLTSLERETSEDKKLTVYVDENGIKHEYPLEDDQYGPCLVEDGITSRKLEIEVGVKVENIAEDGEKYVKNEDTPDNEEIDTNNDYILEEISNKELLNDSETVSKEPKNNTTVRKKRGPNKIKKKRIKTPQRRQVCDECGLSVKNIKHHAMQHQPKDKRPRFQCKACPNLFLSIRGRDKHYKVTHLGYKQKCDICDKGTQHPSLSSSSDVFKLKEEKIHIKSERNRPDYKDLNTSDEDDREECWVPIRLRKVTCVSMHKKSVHNREELRFPCVSCDRRYISRTALEEHMRTHTLDKPYECDMCHKKFKSKYFIKRHILNVHEKQKNFHCQYCSNTFFTKYALTRHIRSHTNEKPYKCEECGKAFPEMDTLKHHQLLHVGVKNFHCPECGKAFMRAKYLSTHMISHTKEKRHPCRYCGVRFGRTDHRNRHEFTAHQK